MSGLRQQVGIAGELSAKEFLLNKGYRWVASNFRTRAGEIDLVMLDGRVLVFVEVKRRRSNEYGLPEEAVTRAKAAHMTKTALLFIKSQGIRDQVIRFDVVTIDGTGIRHHKDAIEATGSPYYY